MNFAKSTHSKSSKVFSASGRFFSVLSDGTFFKKAIGAPKMRHATNSK
jgi:hypothetical protein